ncbi:MAG: OB-fold nucleic acid binding domain-containing protein, partial [Candidatus Paceibacterota bacterium]
MENRILIKDVKDHIGETIVLMGSVDLRRDHGKLIFIDLRDRTGKIQVVINKKHEEVYNVFENAKVEWVLKINGLIKKRMDGTVNENVLNGDLEMEALSGEILGMADELPFERDAEIGAE